MRFFNTVYVLLLSYIIVFIVFWEFSLQRQSKRIFDQEVLTLNSRVDSSLNHNFYFAEVAQLQVNLKHRTYQYIGEGATFVLVILIGATIVYSSFRRRMALSRQQNNFMLSVTHELKSPLAAIKLNLQTIERRKLDEEKRDALIARCVYESNRLNELCNNILFASQFEGRQYKAVKETFDLTELCQSVFQEYSNRYQGRLSIEAVEDCKINGDKIMIQLLLTNLLENAVKYSPSGSPVQLSLSRSNNSLVIRVVDQGKGIPDEEKKNIFNKFYRVGNEESRKSKGTGLGLYIVYKVVQQHRGKITILDNHPSGAIFEILLPDNSK